ERISRVPSCLPWRRRALNIRTSRSLIVHALPQPDSPAGHRPVFSMNPPRASIHVMVSCTDGGAWSIAATIFMIRWNSAGPADTSRVFDTGSATTLTPQFSPKCDLRAWATSAAAACRSLYTSCDGFAHAGHGAACGVAVGTGGGGGGVCPPAGLSQ